MSGISTHVLDIASGTPAANIRVRLYRGDRQVGEAVTDAGGRCPALLPDDVVLEAGLYRLVFEVEPYMNGFFPEVAISFKVHNPTTSYHVPLLLSNYGYTTYRGS